MDLLIARNPDPESRLPFLLRVPLGAGLVFRTAATWPRTGAVYCHPVAATEWPAEPEIVEQVALRACERRGAAIDIVLDRGRESRSQLVFTTARGREAVFWQSARTRKQARPAVRVPTARAAGVAELEIIIDTRERYPYAFGSQQVRTVRRALPSGDYAVVAEGRVVAAVERKSLADLVTSLTNGKLRYALAELASLPRAAVVVEDRFSQVFALTRVRPAVVADGLAELQIRWPSVPVVYAENRRLAEEWTYRYLAAAHTWAVDEHHAVARTGMTDSDLDDAPATPDPTPAELRAWARSVDLAVPDRGRLRPEVLTAWRSAHQSALATPGPASEPGSGTASEPGPG